MKPFTRHFRYANVTATLALTLALGGTSAYAASLVTSVHIKNGTIRNADIHAHTIRANRLANTAKVQVFSNANHTNVDLTSTPTVVDVAVPGAGSYVVVGKTIVTNNDATAGAQVTCTLYVEGTPVDASVTTLEPKAMVGAPNASTDTVSVQGVHNFVAAGTAEVRCDAGGASVTAADGALTVLRLP